MSAYREVKEEVSDKVYFYHLGLDTGMNIEEQFKDVKFVLMGGSAGRMAKVAARILKENDEGRSEAGAGGGPFQVPQNYTLQTVGTTDRFSMYKLGPIICVSHGMGMGSISICLHEVAKLLKYSGATGYTFIRIGSSGGIGVEPGTVIVSTGAVSDLFEEHFPIPVFGKLEKRPCPLDENIAKAIKSASENTELHNHIKHGKTMGCTTFYESQARLDGAISNQKTLDDKKEFLRKCVDMGITNLEMESTAFASFCHQMHIPAAIVCVTLLDRLNGDQISLSSKEEEDKQSALYAEYNSRSIGVALRYVQTQLANTKTN